MTISGTAFAANGIGTKAAVQYLPTPEIMVIRGALAALMALTLVFIVHGARQLPKIANWNILIRSLLEALIGPSLITAYAFLPIATVTGIMQIAPILGMIAGIILFREFVGWKSWAAAITGSIGVLLMIKPGADAFQPMALAIVVVALLTVLRDIQSRRIGHVAPPFVVVLGTALTGIVVSIALTPLLRPLGLRAWGEWIWPDALSFGIVALASFFLIIAHTFAFLAFRSSDMSVVAPFRYVYMLTAVLGGVIIFSEYPDWLSLAGIAMVVAGGLYLLYRERVRSRHSATDVAPTGR